MFKKIICLLLLVGAYYQGYSQSFVGIYNNTISISPNYTVNNNTSYTVTGQVVNTGTTSITGTIHVNIAIDTSSTSTPKYAWRSTMSYPVINLLPNTTIAFSVNDNASNTNGYKIAGNGTTVVAWPIAGPLNDSLTCSDSAFSAVYILPLLQGINELEQLQNELNKLPNPLTYDVQFVNVDNWTIELIDLHGCIVEIQNSKLETQNLSKGLYLLRFRNERGNELTKKILIE